MQYQKYPRYRATAPKLPVADDDFDYKADTPICAVPMPIRLYNALKRATQKTGDITLRELANTYSANYLSMAKEGIGQKMLSEVVKILNKVDMKLTTKSTTVVRPSSGPSSFGFLDEQKAKPATESLLQLKQWMLDSIFQLHDGIKLLDTPRISRPPVSEEHNVPFPVTWVSADVAEIVGSQPNMTEFVEQAVYFYHQQLTEQLPPQTT